MKAVRLGRIILPFIVLGLVGLGTDHAHASGLELAKLINKYRKANGLPAIPVSPQLTKVAQAHVKDLAKHKPANIHSWSKSDLWKGGEFDYSDSATWPIMWNKPKEIAGYPSAGYELACADPVSPLAAFKSWKGSASHDPVILNKGAWKDQKWKAMGVAMHGGYASVWFGTQADKPTRTDP